MWLYIPKMCLVSAQELEDLTSDLDSLAKRFAQSVMWRSKPLPAKSWLRVFKTESWMRLPSGAMSRPLTAERGAELWIRSLEDSLVNRSPMRDASEGLTIHDISGLTSNELSERSNQSGVSLRMYQDCSQPELLTTDTHTKSYQTGYESWVMKLRRDYSVRMRLAHRIGESGYSSWPTPTATSGDQTAQDPTPKQTGGTTLGGMARFLWPTPRASRGESHIATKGGKSLKTEAEKMWRTPNAQEPGISTERLRGKLGHRMYDKQTGRLAQVGLTQQSQMWRSPSASDGEGGVKDLALPKYQKAKQPKIKLRDQTANWATPNSRDWKGSPSKNYKGQKSLPRDTQHYCGRQVPRTLMAGEKSSDLTRQLNPRFAEWLMGWIPGWTHPSIPIELIVYERWGTESYQLLQDLLGQYFQEGY